MPTVDRWKMHSPHTFFGKVTTLLAGIGLSWLTVMHPDVEQAASALIGDARLIANPGPSAREQVDPVLETGETHVRITQSDSSHEVTTEPDLDTREPRDDLQRQITRLSNRLRNLGASYLLLERLSDPGGACYRVRCDLAADHAPVKCCFEAVGATAVEALGEVLRAVTRLDNSSTKIVEAVGSYP